MATRLLDKFLEENKQKSIRLYTINGFQMTGKVIDYDEESIVLRCSEKTGKSFVLRSAISTMELP